LKIFEKEYNMTSLKKLLITIPEHNNEIRIFNKYKSLTKKTDKMIRQSIKRKQTIRGNKLEYKVLHKFWDSFNIMGIDGKLNLLKKYSEIKISEPIEYKQRRKVKGKFNYGAYCRVCYSLADIEHHIILLVKGGSNHRINKIKLCKFCHSQIHKWLECEKYKPEIDMNNAFNMTVKS
jgi:hypothetical protein